MSDQNPEPHPYRALIGLAAIVAGILAMLFIIDRLHQAAQLQDCVQSGRTNCAPIQTRP